MDDKFVEPFKKYCDMLKTYTLKGAIEKIARDRQQSGSHNLFAYALGKVMTVLLRKQFCDVASKNMAGLVETFPTDFLLVQSIEDVCESFQKALKRCQEPINQETSVMQMLKMEVCLQSILEIGCKTSDILTLQLAQLNAPTATSTQPSQPDAPKNDAEKQAVTIEKSEPKPIPVVKQSDIDDYNSALCVAAELGNLERVKFLCEQGASVHHRNDEPLMVAATFGHVEIVKYLCGVGANVHVCSDQALRMASSNGHLEVAKVLVTFGANTGVLDNSPLRYAAERGHTDVVSFLISHGANVCAARNYALRMAAANGHLQTVKCLVSHGAIVDAEHNQAVRTAAARGHLEVVKFLCANGADICALNNEAFHLANQNDHRAVVDFIQSIKLTAAPSITK